MEEAVSRTNEQQRSAMKRLNMEMTGEYTRVADQGLHAALNLLLYVCSIRAGRGQGIRVWLRHTLSAACQDKTRQLASFPAAKAGNSQIGK